MSAYSMGAEYAATHPERRDLSNWGAWDDMPTIAEVYQSSTGLRYPADLAVAADIVLTMIDALAEDFEAGYAEAKDSAGLPPLAALCNHDANEPTGSVDTDGGTVERCTVCGALSNTGDPA